MREENNGDRKVKINKIDVKSSINDEVPFEAFKPDI